MIGLQAIWRSEVFLEWDKTSSRGYFKAHLLEMNEFSNQALKKIYCGL